MQRRLSHPLLASEMQRIVVDHLELADIDCANDFLQDRRSFLSNGDTAPLRLLWIKQVIHRYPQVASIIGRKAGVARANPASPAHIQAFLQLLEETRERLGITHEDIWNMDEMGLL